MNCINVSEAMDRFDNDKEIYLELTETFMETAPADYTGFLTMNTAGKVKEALYHAHKLKGAALTIGAEAIASVAGKIESILRGGEPITDTKLVSDFSDAFSLSMIELEEIITAMKTQP